MSSAETKPSRSLTNRLLFVTVVVVAVGGVLGVIVLAFGRVMGSEFAPEKFARREFVYYRIPLIQLQITPVVRWNDPHDLEDRLTKKNAILTKKPIAFRWDVVSMWAGSSKESGDAEILCNYLDTRDENGTLTWLNWTNDDVPRATPFWRAVHRAAELQAYYFVPGLFELATRYQDAQELTNEVDAYMARQCELLADDYRMLAEQELAEKFYAAALQYDQESKQLKRKHAESQRQLSADKPSDDSTRD